MLDNIEAIRGIKFSLLKHVNHGFLKSKGGVSTGVYKSLNCGHGSKDLKENILSNRKLVTKFFNGSQNNKKLCRLFQTHSNKVVVITDNLQDLDSSDEADAMVTNNPLLILSVLTADCVPVLFADKSKKIIAAAHSGWKGTLNGIIENTLESMISLGAILSDIHVVIGPSIHQKSYEVGKEFLEKFILDDPKNEKFFINSKNKDHYMFDLVGMVYQRLTAAGVINLESINIDTYSEEKDFFSYRRSCHKKESDYGRGISCITLI